MTLYDNLFNSGTDGATANTSSIASSGFGFTKTGTGTAVFSATDAIEGALAIELPRASGSTLAISTNNGLATADVSFSEMFTYKGSLPGTNDYLCDVRTASASIVRVLTNSTGFAFVQNNGVTAGTAGTAFIVNTKYRMDVRVHISTTVGSIHVDFYTPTGTSPLFTGFSLTGLNTGSVNIADVKMGPYGGNTVSAGTFVLDACRLDDSQSSTYRGPLIATAAGVAALSTAAALTAGATLSRLGLVTFTSTASMVAAPLPVGGVVYDDARIIYDDPGAQYDGGVVAQSLTLTAIATMQVDASNEVFAAATFIAAAVLIASAVLPPAGTALGPNRSFDATWRHGTVTAEVSG